MGGKIAGELRLPLQVGTSSLLGFAHAAAAFVPGFLLIGSIALPLLFAPLDDALAVVPHLIVPYIFAFTFGLGLIAYARKHIRLAFRERPSDVVLGPSGMRVEGGPQNGLDWQWNEIRSVKLEVLEDESDKKRTNFWRLVLEFKDGSEVALASAEDAKERESLDALRASIDASLKKSDQTAKKHGELRAPLECQRCGAPIVPGESET